MLSSSLFYKKATVFLVLFSVIAVLFVFAINAYPVPGGDSILYVPAAINIRLGNGFINQLSPAFLSGDPTGTGKFLSLPPLWPIFLSWFMPGNTSQDAYMVMFVIYAITILLASFIYRKIIIPDWQKASWYRIAIYVFSLFSLAAIIIFYPGRPETLSRLFIVISFFGLLFPYKKWLWLFLGILMGLNIAVQPGPAILFAPLIGIFFAFHYDTKKALRLTFLAYITSIITFVGVIEIFSYGIASVLHGLYRHFFVVNSGNLGDHLQPIKIMFPSFLSKKFFVGLITILTTSGSAAFAGSVFTSSLICAIDFYRRFKSKIVAHGPFYLFSFMMAGALFLFFFLRPVSYYMLALVPLYLLIVSYYSTNIITSKILKSATLTIIALSSIVFFHRIALFPFFLKSGTSLEEARANFLSLSLKSDERIGVDGTIWPISENYDQMYLWGDAEDVEYPTGTIIMREGLNGWTELPEKWGYCRKTKDFSTHKKPVVFGFALTNAMPGYAFNVYDCSSGPPHL